MSSFSHGYPMARVNSPRGDRNRGWCCEHRAIADRALGYTCPPNHPVHHYNGKDDHLSLVICEDTAYHWLLEMRTRAYDACGHADWRKCEYCLCYDAPESLVIARKVRKGRKDGTRAYHRLCINARQRAQRRARRAA